MNKKIKLAILISSAALLFIVLITVLSACSLRSAETSSSLPNSKDGSATVTQEADYSSVTVTLEADHGYTPTGREMDSAKVILNYRLKDKGIPNAQLEVKNGIIEIAIPLEEKENKDQIRDLINEIIQVSLLTIQEVDENKVDKNGNYLPTGIIFIQSSDIVDVTVRKNNNAPGIDVKLTSAGSRKFEYATESHIGKPLAVFIDNRFISAPLVQAKISGGNFVINGCKDLQEALSIASMLRSGPLPYRLKIKSME